MTLSRLAIAWVAGIYLAVRFDAPEAVFTLFLLACALATSRLFAHRR